MKGVYSHRWLQSFFTMPLPDPHTVCAGLVRHSFEVESLHEHSGDWVYTLDILPNRSADCLSHYGIAKEIAAIFSLSLSEQYFTEPFLFSETQSYIHTDRCDRYTILKVEDITLSETPPVIQSYLEAIGQRCIAPIVDLSNFILFDIGQPTHAFAAEKVQGAFGVRQARDGETLVLLGGEEVVLSPEDMVITDADRAIALAGIKGGEDTKVDAATHSIYLEIATFQGASVRSTMRRLGCVSDAGLRFSQQLPPEFIDYTAQRTASIFGQYGTVTGSYDSRRVPLRHQRTTGVSLTEVNQHLGTAYTEEAVSDALTRFGFSFTFSNPREEFLRTVRAHVGAPYRWGASVTRDAPDAFDCSSFICFCAAQAGTSLPRMSINQYLSTVPVADPRPGDLVFFHSADTQLPLHTEAVYEAGYPVSPGSVSEGINHVGVLIAPDRVIEAEGSTGANMVVEKPFDTGAMIRASAIWDSDEFRYIVSIPIDRPDLHHGTDLIEEIGRILGYDTVPVSDPAETSPPAVNTVFAKQLSIIRQLREIGFSEILTYSFQNTGAVCVARPVAKDKGCLRTALRPGIVEALKINAHNGELLGCPDIRVVEFGSVFTEAGEQIHMALGVTAVAGRGPVDLKAVEQEIRSRLPLPGGLTAGYGRLH